MKWQTSSMPRFWIGWTSVEYAKRLSTSSIIGFLWQSSSRQINKKDFDSNQCLFFQVTGKHLPTSLCVPSPIYWSSFPLLNTWTPALFLLYQASSKTKLLLRSKPKPYFRLAYQLFLSPLNLVTWLARLLEEGDRLYLTWHDRLSSKEKSEIRLSWLPVTCVDLSRILGYQLTLWYRLSTLACQHLSRAWLLDWPSRVKYAYLVTLSLKSASRGDNKPYANHSWSCLYVYSLACYSQMSISFSCF